MKMLKKSTSRFEFLTFLSPIKKGSVLWGVSYFNDLGSCKQLHDQAWSDNRWDPQLHQSTWRDILLLSPVENTTLAFCLEFITSWPPTSVWGHDDSHPVEWICRVWGHDAKKRNLEEQNSVLILFNKVNVKNNSFQKSYLQFSAQFYTLKFMI